MFHVTCEAFFSPAQAWCVTISEFFCSMGFVNFLESVYQQQPVTLLLFCICMAVALWVIVKVVRLKRRVYVLKIHDPKRAHRWQMSEFLDKPTYCNSCLNMCISGSYCESCGLCICTESRCLKMASTSQSCKPLSISVSNKMPHFWVHGNLPLYSLCFKCLAPCGNLPKLADFRCVWCHKTGHEDCIEDMDSDSNTCCLGPHQSLVIPPNCVTLDLEGWRGRRKLIVKAIKSPSIDHWQPLVVMANPRSGGKDGEMVLSALRKLLNPIQVIDLSETPPESGLEICRLLSQHSCRLLVCGGDGTVGWVLGAIDKCKLPTPPHVAILPLGTGNDLARVLGWGKGYESEDVSEILRGVEHAQLSLLDRWQVKIECKKTYLGLKRGAKVLTMNNYLGVGCDAGVALNFHRHRESRPELFMSRGINKAWYVGFGAKDVLEQSCKNLHRRIEVYLDGVSRELPELEGVVVLNINSWSAGCSVWNDHSTSDQFGSSRIDDELLEVVGLYSSLHVGKIQVSLAEPLRLGQASEIKIIIRESVPIQVDGEPWQQGPASLTITHHGQAHMLRRVEHN